jgi:hypothetical protein
MGNHGDTITPITDIMDESIFSSELYRRLYSIDRDKKYKTVVYEMLKDKCHNLGLDPFMDGSAFKYIVSNNDEVILIFNNESIYTYSVNGTFPEDISEIFELEVNHVLKTIETLRTDIEYVLLPVKNSRLLFRPPHGLGQRKSKFIFNTQHILLDGDRYYSVSVDDWAVKVRTEEDVLHVSGINVYINYSPIIDYGNTNALIDIVTKIKKEEVK